MSEHVGTGAQQDNSRAPEPSSGDSGAIAPEAALRKQHAARAASAAARATAVCHYVERHVPREPREGGMTNEQIVWKAGNAARVSAQALAVLAESAPDPAADSRCARNAAASAAQAAQAGQLCDGDGDSNSDGSSSEPSAAACRAAIKASQSAGAAATAAAKGEDEALNAAADADEEAAVAAAVAAGWVKPGEQLPEVSTGVRSADLMSMMHL
ncbi:hypothetical protein ACH4SP_15305 [Streptomyces sp. NPDC021093]|uniref:hypothetical protein n=1 Tax=Streptomyces sp. NPDC021093 TaxID=3365112 RepID=UPI0037A2B39E